MLDVENSPNMHFHGFDAEDIRRLRDSWSALSFHRELPGLTEISGGTVAPLNVRGVKSSGVYDRDCGLVPSSTRFRGGKRVEADLDGTRLRGAAYDDRDAYYAGCGEKHFGDFLLEVLSRAWAWRAHGDDRVAVVQRDSAAFARPLYALVPGLPDKLKVVRRPTRFRSVLVPAPSFVMLSSAWTAFKQLCEGMAERALTNRPVPTDQPVYLSRTGLDDTKRAVLGEDQLERLLRTEGFLIVRPETLSIHEQIALYNRHRWIVSSVGSACHTRVFSLVSNTLVTLAPGLINENHILCDMLCEGDAHYVRALTQPDLGINLKVRNLAPVMLDRDVVLSTFKKIGLVRDGAAFEGPPPDVEEYKRRWLAVAKWLARSRPAEIEALNAAIAHVSASLPAKTRAPSGVLTSAPDRLRRLAARIARSRR